MVRKAPIEIVVSADITTRRIPNFSISAAAKGDINPKRRTFIATAKEISERDQPKASSSGTMRTDGADLNPAVAISVAKVTATAIQPG
jgi:hypothetical protein